VLVFAPLYNSCYCTGRCPHDRMEGRPLHLIHQQRAPCCILTVILLPTNVLLVIEWLVPTYWMMCCICQLLQLEHHSLSFLQQRLPKSRMSVNTYNPITRKLTVSPIVPAARCDRGTERKNVSLSLSRGINH
jgi:hypothetical protein